jgi:hypothetical protein
MIPIDEVVHFDVTTHNPSTAGISDADSTPTFSVFEEATDTPILSAQSFTKRTALTGDYRGTFTVSLANGFEVGKWYNVVATAVVGGITGKCTAMTFRAAPPETVAGRPLVDVDLVQGQTPPGAATVASAVFEEAMAGHTTAGTYGDKLRAHSTAVLKGLATSGGSTTTIPLNASTGVEGAVPSSVNDFYKNRVVVFITGTLAGQAASISAYNGSTKVLTVGTMTGSPSSGDTFVIV